MRPTPFTALLAVTFCAVSARAQQPAPSPVPTPPVQPDSGAPRDTAARGAPRPGMMQDSMARRGMPQDGMARPGMTRDSMGGAVARQGDTALVAQLDSVNTAAGAGLTSLPVSVAVPLLRSIETKLRATGRPSLLGIANDLASLRRELGASTVSGPRVGAVLRRVGPKVTTVSVGQSGALRTTLGEIGRALSAAGRQLSTAPAR